MNYLWWVGKYLEVLFDTWFGTLFQRKYCEAWDGKLNEIISRGCFVKFHKNFYGNLLYTVIVDLDGVKFEIWLANKWYCYGYNYAETNYNEQFRPSIKTMIKLEKWVNELQEMEKNNK